MRNLRLIIFAVALGRTKRSASRRVGSLSALYSDSGDELGKGHSIIRAWLFQRMALKRFDAAARIP